MATRSNPIPNRVYSLIDINYDLHLKDSPFLLFYHENLRGTIQTNHLSETKLLNIPKMKYSKWRYDRTTTEWIPLFYFSVDNDFAITEIVDLEKYQEDGVFHWWATPKGYPRDRIA